MTYCLSDLNQMSQAAFTEALGSIFEHTPQIAQAAWHQRTFDSVTDLHQAMEAVVQTFSPSEQLALVKAHPDLGSRAKMAEASVQEQAGVGLDRLSAEEYETFHRLNTAYQAKFGFPFIIAVKNHTKASILEAFEQRLHHEAADELAQAIAEIGQIALFRLREAVALP